MYIKIIIIVFSPVIYISFNYQSFNNYYNRIPDINNVFLSKTYNLELILQILLFFVNFMLFDIIENSYILILSTFIFYVYFFFYYNPRNETTISGLFRDKEYIPVFIYLAIDLLNYGIYGKAIIYNNTSNLVEIFTFVLLAFLFIFATGGGYQGLIHSIFVSLFFSFKILILIYIYILKDILLLNIHIDDILLVIIVGLSFFYLNNIYTNNLYRIQYKFYIFSIELLIYYLILYSIDIPTIKCKNGYKHILENYNKFECVYSWFCNKCNRTIII